MKSTLSSAGTRCVLVCIFAALGWPVSAALTEVRTIDGTGNQQTPALENAGAAGQPLARHPLAPADYPGPGYFGEEILEPPARPNPRVISNTIAAQGSFQHYNLRKLTDFVWQWGQFVDHDIDLTESGPEAGTADIPVPEGDILGPGPIPFDRSFYAAGTGVPGTPRQQINSITSFIDASQVYGSDPLRAAALRTSGGTGAKLRVSEGNLLPFNTDGLPNAGGPDPALFLAGDVRANEQVGLTSMHTLFVREHNRLVDALAALPDPPSDQEALYQTARKIVGAEIQVITYKEFLPALLGENPTSLDTYTGYNDSLDPSISNDFSTALYRVGHTMLPEDLMLVDNSGELVAALPLRDCFFNPSLLSEPGNEGTLDLLLKGLSAKRMQEVDNLLVDDVRNFLFGPPGAGGIDLAAMNIQRGRDHGLPDYNRIREAYGLEPVTGFDQITSDSDLQAALEMLYGNVDNIDAWVGALAEDHLPGMSVGQLVYMGVVDQFLRLRDGDRFFFLNDPDLDQPEIRSVIDLDRVTLADIIRFNTGITNIRRNVFVIPEPPAAWLLAGGVLLAVVAVKRGGWG